MHPTLVNRDGNKVGAVARGVHRLKGLDADLQPGKTHVFNLEGLPSEKHGLCAHISYLKLTGTFTVDTVLATMPEGIPTSRLLSLFSQCNLRIAGHDHFTGEDGYTISTALTMGAEPGLFERFEGIHNSTIPDADATGSTYAVEMFVPLESFSADESLRYDRVIPADVFNRGARDKSVFSITTAATNAEWFPGVTATALSSVELEIGLVYLPFVNQPTRWTVRTERDSKKVKHIQSEGAFQALYIENRIPTSLTHFAYELRQVTLDSTPLFDQPRSAVELISEVGVLHASDRDSAYSDGSYLGTFSHVPIFLPAPGERRLSRLPAGMARIEVNTRGVGHTDDRIVVVDTGIRTQEYDRLFRRELGAPDTASEGGIGVIGSANGKGGALAPFLPVRLLWPGSPYRAVSSRAAKKLAGA